LSSSAMSGVTTNVTLDPDMLRKNRIPFPQHNVGPRLSLSRTLANVTLDPDVLRKNWT
jgi:hypothetical protein